MWYTEKLNIFSLLRSLSEDPKTTYAHFSRPARYRSGRSRGGRRDYPDSPYDFPNRFVPFLWNRIFAYPKSLYTHAPRSSLRWASNSSHHACTPFFLQKEHLCSKDFRGTTSRSLPSSRPAYQTAARSSPPTGTL